MAMMTVDKMNSFDWGLTAPRCVDLGVQKKNVGEMWYRFFFFFVCAHVSRMARSSQRAVIFCKGGGGARDDVRLYFCLLIIARL
jgi:hypothetical protein